MKTAITIFLMTLSFSFALSQTKDDTIKSIEQKCNAIKQDSSLKIVTIFNEEFLDSIFLKQAGHGYGQLQGYYKDDKIYRISERIGIRLLNDLAETDYYFSDGKLIFVYEKEIYNPSVYTDSAGTSDYKAPGPDFEGYYYFNNEKNFTTTTKGKQQILPNEMYFDSQSKEGQLLSSAEIYIDLLTKKKNK